jgi:hypothetical protein
MSDRPKADRPTLWPSAAEQEALVEQLKENVTAQLTALFGDGSDLPGGFATGGVVAASVMPEREGVVGYLPGGKPVYDGEWFDQQMAKLGPSITVKVSGLQAMRDRLDTIPETTRAALLKAMFEPYQKGQKR